MFGHEHVHSPSTLLHFTVYFSPVATFTTSHTRAVDSGGCGTGVMT